MNKRKNSLNENKGDKNINELIKHFPYYVDKFYNIETKKEKKPNYPDIYFYTTIVKRVRKEHLNSLLDDEKFIGYIYACLVCWGMRRGTAKLEKFSNFNECIQRQKTGIVEMSDYKLSTLKDEEKKIVTEELIKLYLGLAGKSNTIKEKRIRVMYSEAQLVGVSKTMHFLLPDLVPPVDREYTLNFFYDSKNYSEKIAYKKYSEIFDHYWYICNKRELTKKDLKEERPLDTSVPKLIDNAIIGYIREKK